MIRTVIACRYLINLDGTTGSSRLFKILPRGSLVLKQESRWLQWCAKTSCFPPIPHPTAASIRKPVQPNPT